MNSVNFVNSFGEPISLLVFIGCLFACFEFSGASISRILCKALFSGLSFSFKIPTIIPAYLTIII